MWLCVCSVQPRLYLLILLWFQPPNDIIQYYILHPAYDWFLSVSGMRHEETLKVERCGQASFHLRWWRHEVTTASAVAFLTDAACNLHISVGVEQANQSRAPITAHAYHLHTAAVAPLRERVRRVERERERKERARMNGAPETEGDLRFCRTAHLCLRLSFIWFQSPAF